MTDVFASIGYCIGCCVGFIVGWFVCTWVNASSLATHPRPHPASDAEAAETDGLRADTAASHSIERK